MHNSSVVTYANGQLTINAENLTLAALLKLIAEKTGAVIDLPPGTGHERIFEHAGPGKPNDVLTQLLNGSHFNFVIVNSPQDPNASRRARVLLRRRGPKFLPHERKNLPPALIRLRNLPRKTPLSLSLHRST